MIFIHISHIKTTLIIVLVSIVVLAISAFSIAAAGRQDSSLTSGAVASKIIVIDPGHGGIDPGAIGPDGIKEKDITLKVSLQLEKLLKQAGAKVILTRTSDTDLSDISAGNVRSRKRDDLTRRVNLANDNKADLFISIHVNAFPSAKWHGAQTFFQKNEEQSKIFAHSMQAELVRVLGNTTRIAKAGNFFTTEHTEMPGIIVEMGFISNPSEAALLNDAEYQKKMAGAIYAGIVRYINNPVNKYDDSIDG